MCLNPINTEKSISTALSWRPYGLTGNKVIEHTWAAHHLWNVGGVVCWEGVGFYLEGTKEFSEEAILKQCLERKYVVKRSGN